MKQFNAALPPDSTEGKSFFRVLREGWKDLVHHLKGLMRDGDAFVFDSMVSAPQFTSTVATGTGPPLVVASTDRVVGLNADQLDDQSGAYYLDRGNHTGTQLAATISDFATAARALLSVLDGTNIDLSYNSTTGVISASITGQVGLANGGTAVDGTARTANTVFSGPAAGGAGSATFRALVVNDIPTLTSAKISDFAAAARALLSVTDGTNIDLTYNSSTGVITASITGTVAVGNGGTGLSALGAANTVLAVNAGATANAYALLVNANVDAAAAIAWSKLSKSGSSLADLATRSAGDLNSGTLLDARLSSNVPLKDASPVFSTTPTVPNLILNAAAGVTRDVQWRTAGATRWYLRVNATAESGGSAGSDLELHSRSDAAADATVLSFVRATGTGTFGGAVVVTGVLTASAEAIHQANSTLGANAGSYGGGNKVTFVGNVATAPTSNPTGGGILYAESGAGKWRGASGTITTFGPAEPHCPVCGGDFGHEWESEQFGYLAVCVRCLVEEIGARPYIRHVKPDA